MQLNSVNELGLETDHLLRAVHPFNRLNLFYEIRYFSEASAGVNNRQDDILAFIEKISRSSTAPTTGVVYCRSKKSVDDVAKFLRGYGVLASPYHR